MEIRNAREVAHIPPALFVLAWAVVVALICGELLG